MIVIDTVGVRGGGFIYKMVVRRRGRTVKRTRIRNVMYVYEIEEESDLVWYCWALAPKLVVTVLMLVQWSIGSAVSVPWTL
jgi:hypothetical protein